jgi:hypothetical protein
MDEPGAPSSSASDSRIGSEPVDEAPSEAFRDAVAQVGELKEYASHFIAAKVDGLKLSVRKAVIFAGLGLVAVLAAATVVITAVVLLLAGSAQALGVLLGGRAWAGNLLVGSIVLVAVGLGAWIFQRRFFNTSRKATVQRYERRLKTQRVRHNGHDAVQRGSEGRAESAE